MKRILGSVAVAGLLLTAPAAFARVDVTLGFFVPAPVYVAPQPVYVAPQPVYVARPRVYYAPEPVYVAPPAPYYRAVYYGGPRWRNHGYWERERRHGRH